MKTRANRPTELEGAGLIVAYADRKGRAADVGRTAMDVAQRTGARLILYALDDYMPLADPLPTAWSGDHEPGEFSDPLTADDLEMVGHPALAEHVAEAHGLGVSVGGWLPREGGVDAMVDYAREHGAEVVLLPDDRPTAGYSTGLSVRQRRRRPSRTGQNSPSCSSSRLAPSGTQVRRCSARASARYIPDPATRSSSGSRAGLVDTRRRGRADARARRQSRRRDRAV